MSERPTRRIMDPRQMQQTDQTGQNQAQPNQFMQIPGQSMTPIPEDYRQQDPMMRTMAPNQPAPNIPAGIAGNTSETDNARRMGEQMAARGIMQLNGIAPKDQMQDEARLPIGREEINEATQTLLRYKSDKSSVDRRIIANQQWWKLRNWQEIHKDRHTKGSTIAKTNTAWLWNCIVGKHADAMDSYPEPVILPRMMDDKQEAQKLTEIVPVVMQMNDFEDTYSQCQWQKMQEGTAGYGVFWDKTKLNGIGDIAIRKINLLNLFWEPGIQDIQDSKNLFYVTLQDNDNLEGMYPQLVGKLKTLSIQPSKYLTDDTVPTTDKSAVVDWYYKRWEGNRQVLHYVKYCGEEILYSSENQGLPGIYDDGLYPYVLDPLFPVQGSPCGYGYIDIGKDAQTDIDTLNQALVQNAAASATPRYFIRKDGDLNEDEFADFSKPFVHTSGNLGSDAIQPVVVNTLSGNSISMMQQKIDELKFVTGNMDVNNGGTPTGVTAASAIAALKEDAGRSSKDSNKAAYRAYSKIVNMVIERIRQFYDIPRQFRILGAEGEKFVSMDNSGMQMQPIQTGMGMDQGYRMPVFDIEVRAQRETAYTKMAQNELALQFYNAGMFAPQNADMVVMCLDMMEFKGKEELVQKIQQNRQMMEMLAKVSQVAMTLAQKYDPAIAQQLAPIVQGVVGNQMQTATPTSKETAAKLPDQKDSTEDQSKQETSQMKRTSERVANATRV